MSVVLQEGELSHELVNRGQVHQRTLLMKRFK
jgi:hypothetical protein